MARLIGTLTMLLAGVNAFAGDVQSAEGTKKGDPMHPRVKVETTLGDFVLELDVEKASVTVINFIQYGEDKFYNGTIFHRVKQDFMIQGGGYMPTMDSKTEGLRPGIKNEWENGLKHVRGTIAMARQPGRPDSATSQFFINVVDNPFLDDARDGAGYAVFGKVVEGMDTVDKIRDTPVGTHPKYGGGKRYIVPVDPVVIKSVQVISEFDRAKVEAVAKAAQSAADKTEEEASAERAKKMREHAKKIAEETGKKAVTTESGLIYFDLKQGDGPTPGKTDRVEVHYTGWLLDGTKFDSSFDHRDGRPASFPLDRVIAGWTEGVGTMKVGGKRKLVIPPELGYGTRGSGSSIPPNSILVFEVELLKIVK